VQFSLPNIESDSVTFSLFGVLFNPFDGRGAWIASSRHFTRGFQTRAQKGNITGNKPNIICEYM